MTRQRNTTQMKKQTRNTEVQINEEEIGKLSEKEFRMIVKMIKKNKNLENKMEKNARINKQNLEELKNKYTERNDTINEIQKKKTLEGINSRISEA